MTRVAGTAPADVFPAGLLEGPVDEVARALLGSRLVSTVGGRRVVGMIVETEAYGGPGDPASHAATASGVTARNRVMFGPPGHAYVYRSYGVHWCMNVVTGREGEAGAVLVRGIVPIDGEEVMRERRRGAGALGAGPGRLCQALGITGALYGHRLTEAPLVLESGAPVDQDEIGTSRRVGVSSAADWLRRFYVLGSAGVSRPDGWGAVGRDPVSR